jgi:hypothetical protein
MQGEPSANNVEADMNDKDIYKIVQSIRVDWRETFFNAKTLNYLVDSQAFDVQIGQNTEGV